MPAARIIDLDALAPADVTAKLGGKTYRFPGDCPLPIFLRVQALQQKVEDGATEDELLDEIQGVVLDLFRAKQPTMKSLPDGLGLIGLLGLIGNLYGDGTEAEPDPPTPPTPARRAAAGTRNTSRPKR